MPSWRKVVTSGSSASLSSLYVTNAITASIFSGSFTGPLSGTASWASYAGTSTQIQSGSITASINPSSGTFNITSGSTNLVYISSSTGEMRVRGLVTASSLNAAQIGQGTGTNVTAETVQVQYNNVSNLLSFDKMTSLKSFTELSGSTSQSLATYLSTEYFGVVIDGVIYDKLGDSSAMLRSTFVNTQDVMGTGVPEYLSFTDSNIKTDIFTNISMSADMTPGGGLVTIKIINNGSVNYRFRPMYRLLKQCITQ